MTRLVLATTNPGKLAELQQLLDDSGIEVEVVARPDGLEVVEDAPDFVGNARKKATEVAAATGEWALADDSGLEVDALGGAPGVRSARFAGDDATDADNVALLLQLLRDQTAATGSDRAPRARFRCAIVLRHPDGTELVAEGSVEGSIVDSGRGSNGFGYDPVFVPDECDGRTFAEMSSEEKHAVSHRGRALGALIATMPSGFLSRPVQLNELPPGTSR